MYIKICGITQPEQAVAIADMGIDALGFICVPQSKRYIAPQSLAQITANLPSTVEQIGVFVNAGLTAMQRIIEDCHLTGVQLHGQESPSFCDQLRELYPQHKLIKAIAVASPADLELALSYAGVVDVLLLDAYDPFIAGGTGKQIDWQALGDFAPPMPWWLAGGINPQNVLTALSLANPDGVDLSSGVEITYGIKDLAKIQGLLDLCK